MIEFFEKTRDWLEIDFFEKTWDWQMIEFKKKTRDWLEIDFFEKTRDWEMIDFLKKTRDGLELTFPKKLERNIRAIQFLQFLTKNKTKKTRWEYSRFFLKLDQKNTD